MSLMFRSRVVTNNQYVLKGIKNSDHSTYVLNCTNCFVRRKRKENMNFIEQKLYYKSKISVGLTSCYRSLILRSNHIERRVLRCDLRSRAIAGVYAFTLV